MTITLRHTLRWHDQQDPRHFGWQLSGNISAICPDRLRYDQLGEADTLRGRVVRGLFWLLRWWPT